MQYDGDEEVCLTVMFEGEVRLGGSALNSKTEKPSTAFELEKHRTTLAI
jgi:hypothetical protein